MSADEHLAGLLREAYRYTDIAYDLVNESLETDWYMGQQNTFEAFDHLFLALTNLRIALQERGEEIDEP